MSDTIFDKIARGDIDAFIIWEDDNYMAFLTPFPNTPGVTVVMPKKHIGDYVFELTDDEYTGLNGAVKTVAELLKKALGVNRVALVFEGTGVAYVHAKLYPLHGDLGRQTDVWVHDETFNENYQGFISTIEGPKMDDAELKAIQTKIREAQ